MNSTKKYDDAVKRARAYGVRKAIAVTSNAVDAYSMMRAYASPLGLYCSIEHGWREIKGNITLANEAHAYYFSITGYHIRALKNGLTVTKKVLTPNR